MHNAMVSRLDVCTSVRYTSVIWLKSYFNSLLRNVAFCETLHEHGVAYTAPDRPIIKAY